MEHSKCSIFHSINIYMIFQRRQKALIWSKGLRQVTPRVYAYGHYYFQVVIVDSRKPKQKYYFLYNDALRSAILSTCTKLPPVFKSFVLSIYNGRLRQVTPHVYAYGNYSLQVVIVDSRKPKQKYYFLYNGWIAKDEGEGKLWREITAKKSLPKELQSGKLFSLVD